MKTLLSRAGSARSVASRYLGVRLIVVSGGQRNRHLRLARGRLLLRDLAVMFSRLSWRMLLRLSVLQIMPLARCVRSVGFQLNKAKK